MKLINEQVNVQYIVTRESLPSFIGVFQNVLVMQLE